MEAILSAISTVGFPIAVSCYLLYTQSKYLQSIKESLDNNTKAINELARSINNEHS